MSDSEFEYLIEKLLFEDVSSQEEDEILQRIIKAGRSKDLERIIG